MTPGLRMIGRNRATAVLLLAGAAAPRLLAAQATIELPAADRALDLQLQPPKTPRAKAPSTS